MSEFDIDGTDTLICPHCGEDNGNDDLGHSGRIDCTGCGKEFHYEADYTVTYSTSCVEHDYPDEWREVKWQAGWLARSCNRCGNMEVKQQ